jgi:poly-gamma-glutamate capsule biosynthesis protein CapA/YwtB (metallophosphatase superfamily)
VPAITLFLCGDVMTGRGVDQVLAHPSDPVLYEPYVESALEYVEMAEKTNGPIPKPVDYPYIWGDALDELERMAPHARIINLETSVTTSRTHALKDINYRMHPANAPVLTAAKIDCCVLANNHVLDWSYPGLTETLATLHGMGIKTAGAGENLIEALEPAVIESGAAGRVLVFSVGMSDCGIPCEWAASGSQAGIALLPEFSDVQADRIAERVRAVKRPGDVAVLSIHWGDNWGYPIPEQHRAFAHRLVDTAGIDIIHGHSSHHAKAIEIYGNKPILYGCGDFINDYEGIAGYEEFRSHLVLMYFVSLDASTGNLQRLEMVPLETKRFRLNRVSRRDAQWLRDMLSRTGRQTGTEVILTADDHLVVETSEPHAQR